MYNVRGMTEEQKVDFLKRQALNKHYKLPSGCWMWAGHFGNDGYGKTKWLGDTIRAHRLIWKLLHGEIPEGLWVLHKCDNRQCVNPEHLFLGTQLDNEKDKDAKGRRRNRYTVKTLGRLVP